MGSLILKIRQMESLFKVLTGIAVLVCLGLVFYYNSKEDISNLITFGFLCLGNLMMFLDTDIKE